MGYDMNWQVVPESIAKEAAKNKAAWDKLVQARDSMFAHVRPFPGEDPVNEIVRDTIRKSPEYAAAQKAVEDGWPNDPAYYRLNIWGMQTMRRLMAELGIGYASSQADEWPEPEEYGFKWADDPDMEDPKVVAHQEAADAVRRGGGGGVGIPLHKFGSNDGWIVTPDEIRQGLYAYDGLDQTTIDTAITNHCDLKECGVDEWRKWLDDWMEWNRRAMNEGEGYTVW